MLLTALAFLAQAQPPTGVWEKLLAPGVTYRMEVAPGPLLVHAVRITTEAEGVLLAGELATGKVFDPGSATQGRETISAMAARRGSIVAVNADFFPYTGDPLGAMVRDGELVSSPHAGRAVFAWGKNFSQTAYLTFSAGMRFEDKTQPIYGVNMECGDNMVVLNTPAAHFATSRQPATHAVLLMTDKVEPAGESKPRVKRIVTNATSVPINDDEIVLTYRGTPTEKLTFLSQGDEVLIRTDCKGLDWSKAKNVVGGGPFLVREGKPFVPYGAEGFTDGFAKNKHPRTAIGRNRQGDIWVVTVDGRQAMSSGVTLADMALVMAGLGCTEAINLDGGGSTTMNVLGTTVNRPSEGSERAVANAILVFSSSLVQGALPVGEPTAVIAGPAELKVGGSATYRVVDSTGEDVPNAEVVWSAQGAAWIDQGGRLTASSEGECKVTAVVSGRPVSLPVTVVKP